MSQEKIKELITDFVDGEITDTSQINEIKNLIEKDEGLRFDYLVQHLMKSIIADKLKIKPVPERIRKKVIKKINPSKRFLFFA